jgi:hypothetical protein
MKHRSPLVTLVVATVWFLVLLVANMVVQPGGTTAESGASPPGETGSPPTSAPATPSNEPSTGASTSPSPSATKTRDDNPYPARVVYAGRTRDGDLAVAVAVLNGRAAAYLCDGSRVEAWLKGSVDGDEVKLLSRRGYELRAELEGARLVGRIEGPGEPEHRFSIGEARKPAGLYRAKGSRTTIGWIVLPDGSQVGVATTAGGTSAPAPALDPNTSTISVDGKDVEVETVSGDAEM